MDHSALNLFDIIVGLVVVLSTLLSFFRGFVREMLSLSSWIGATIFTLYAFPHVAHVIEHHIADKTLASGFAAILTFLVGLVLISIVSGVLLKFLKKGPDVGLLDHGMGLLFGFARGVLIVSMGYFIFTLAVKKDDYPEWMKGSITRPFVAKSARVVAHMAPSYLDELTTDAKKRMKQADDALADMQKKPDTDTDDADSDDETPVVRKAKEDTKKTVDWPTADDLKKRIQNTDETK